MFAQEKTYDEPDTEIKKVPIDPDAVNDDDEDEAEDVEPEDVDEDDESEDKEQLTVR